MSPEIEDYRIERMDEMTLELLHKKTPAERLAIAFDCNRTMRLRLEGHIRTYNPDWDDAQVAAEVARRMSRGAG